MVLDDADNLTVDQIDYLNEDPAASQHHSLKHSLLGPSLTKAGQDAVDQKKVSEIIYEASKGSKFFNNEEVRDQNLTVKIDRILELKAQLEKLDLKSELRRADDYIASLELSRDLSQYVVHIDCDAFYAAVEEIDRPELKTKPMAVGIGVLTTCNYEARKYGCRSAMAGFVAKKLCPELICLPLNFDKYTAKAKEVRAIFAEYDPRFESSSIDEAYLNITEYCENHHLDPEAAIQQLRNEVHEKCKITISAGIAPNAKIAKICSNKNKPNGQFRVPNDRAAVMAFMSGLSTRKVNGVGRVFERELDAIGVKTCGDIYIHRAYLNRLFGEKAFQFLMQTYLGLGRTSVQPAEEYERKSVGTESTFRDISSKQELREKLRHTAEELEKDMARVQVKGRTLVLKIKLHTYEVFTRQVAPPKAVHMANDLYNYSLPMLVKLEKEMPDFRLRLMGLRCTHLVSTKKDKPDFFRRRVTNASSTGKFTSEDGEWEVWPDSEFEEAARQERQDEMEELHRLSQEQEPQAEQEDSTPSGADWHEPFGRYKYGSEPNSPAKHGRLPNAQKVTVSVQEGQIWDCPICQVPQPANDKDFNDHIDLCLSRQTIKEAVAQAEVDTTAAPPKPSLSKASSVESGRASPEVGSSVSAKRRSENGIKRKDPAPGDGQRKQKRLFFT
ncbi:DNA polymerase kappa subunit [Exophiala aquamarina CBS 119918]|uniref:DNA polymerase kappa n=1 Tax=Exophiala aquamarina CBS 119918 TaxID=1182545 RepID=A0A072PR36_9EURO|nr:DNA polymerase kappa subunit [Exophiala aquamarina CBS 119918]KEF62212.1 DNA polymerase kappa subunit [Exophiala aquamarina CBS 119918]